VEEWGVATNACAASAALSGSGLGDCCGGAVQGHDEVEDTVKRVGE
jgi:hypothetical protein